MLSRVQNKNHGSNFIQLLYYEGVCMKTTDRQNVFLNIDQLQSHSYNKN